MELTASGTIGYAGLSEEGLLSRAKTAFTQAQPAVPERFDAFLPLFPAELIQNMEYIGAAYVRGARVAPNGFSIDPVEYFAKLYARLPELCAGDNALRNFTYEGRYVGRGVFTVDGAWAERFPQYRPFMGEKLTVYLIGGGSQAVAVPESVYPRGGGVLRAAEKRMQVAKRAGDFVLYVRGRVAAGERYDADAFARDFLRDSDLVPVSFPQRELERVLQDLSVVKSLQNGTSGAGHYTENARRAGRVNQYVPMRCACDRFSKSEADRHTAWLAQLYWRDGEYTGDLWIPYPDFFACVDKRTMTLDVRRLCEAYQIAPRYDPETGGGCYPDAVRVASVREHGFELLTGETLNNPAYGDGLSPEGGAGVQVYVADSGEMIRQRKLVPEKAAVTMENHAVPPAEYRRMLRLAILQEHKGRLIDAMYRCETALRQIDPKAPVYARARRLLTERADRLDAVVTREAEEAGAVRTSGYDLDIAYLRRMRRAREGAGEGETTGFTPDAIREESIEGGYAMRAGLLRMMYADASLPEPPAEQTEGAYDSEYGEEEPLPPITAGIGPEAAPEEKREPPAEARRQAEEPEAGPEAPDNEAQEETGAKTREEHAPKADGEAESAADGASEAPQAGAARPVREEQLRIEDLPEEPEPAPREADGGNRGRDNARNETDTDAESAGNGKESRGGTAAPRRRPITLRELAGRPDAGTGAQPAAPGADRRMAEFLKRRGG